MHIKWRTCAPQESTHCNGQRYTKYELRHTLTSPLGRRPRLPALGTAAAAGGAVATTGGATTASSTTGSSGKLRLYRARQGTQAEVQAICFYANATRNNHKHSNAFHMDSARTWCRQRRTCQHNDAAGATKANKEASYTRTYHCGGCSCV